MTKRNENLVAVKDKDGQLFEVTVRNATDLVQHNGWTYVNAVMTELDAKATSPRAKRPRDEKLTAAKELVAKGDDSKAKGDDSKAKGGKKKLPKKEEVAEAEAEAEVEDVVEPEDDVTPFDER